MRLLRMHSYQFIVRGRSETSAVNVKLERDSTIISAPPSHNRPARRAMRRSLSRYFRRRYHLRHNNIPIPYLLLYIYIGSGYRLLAIISVMVPPACRYKVHYIYITIIIMKNANKNTYMRCTTRRL